MMSDIIVTHAQCGPFSAWPYAGALCLEQDYETRREQPFRSLLAAFRSKLSRAEAWVRAH